MPSHVPRCGDDSSSRAGSTRTTPKRNCVTRPGAHRPSPSLHRHTSPLKSSQLVDSCGCPELLPTTGHFPALVRAAAALPEGTLQWPPRPRCLKPRVQAGFRSHCPASSIAAREGGRGRREGGRAAGGERVTETRTTQYYLEMCHQEAAGCWKRVELAMQSLSLTPGRPGPCLAAF
jgi:hypothetical protein